MDRNTIKAARDLIASVDKALEELPYRTARPAMASLNELMELVEDELPGGFYGQCEGCEELIGNDDPDPYMGEDVTLCATCYDRAPKEPVEEDAAFHLHR